MNQHEIDMDAIAKCLNESEKYNLSIEVLLSTFHYLKQNPTSSISDAVDFGISQWIK